MSRIGNRLIKVPDSLNLAILDDVISVSKGKEKIHIHYNKYFVKVTFANQEFKTEKANNSKHSRAQFGTVNALVNNAIIGLTEGFTKHLEIVGVGYKAAMEGKKLKLSLGHSHPIYLDIPPSIQLTLVSSIEIKLSSPNKEELGEFAALIRKFRSPEPYKGKGIKYKSEVIVRKVGKTADGKK